MKRIIIVPIILCLAAVVAGCGAGGGGTGSSLPSSRLISSVAEASQPGTWTILVFLNGDNDLESSAILNMNQMEQIGSTQDCRIVVQIDRATGYDTSDGDWTDTRRYLITQDPDSSRINSLRLDTSPLGELDMGDWQTLRDFVNWGMTNFPADHYCVILWDHGTGWRVAGSADVPSQKKYISWDMSTGNTINVRSIPFAFAGAPDTCDVIAFDACLMQQMEVAYELRNTALYQVASPAEEPAPGYPYHKWLAHIGATTTPKNLCSHIIREYVDYYTYNGIIMSAVDLTRMDGLASAVNDYANVLITKKDIFGPQFATARTSTLNYSTCGGGSERYTIDLWEYASRTQAVVGFDIQDEWTALQTAFANAVFDEAHNADTPTAKGLAIYLPPPANYDLNYNLLDLAGATTWDEWIQLQTQ